MQGLKFMKDKIVILDDMQKCTGCGACQNICPVDAINFEEGYQTFEYPTIDHDKCIACGKCVKTCPVNLYKNTNTLTPTIYAAAANDEIRQNSSSGGLFTLFAKYIISNGGCVFGCTIDDRQKVLHIKIEHESDIVKCVGSKYVQSDIGLIYRNVKTELETGRVVLFTGCPCQIAGLNKFLNKIYNNLYTIDLLCHGVPSHRLFEMYLEELNFGKINSVRFRNKDLGWRADTVTVTNNTGNKYIKSWRGGDPFEIMFQDNLGLRESCENCEFATFPRVADISLGDFWGIQKFLPVDGLGTSLVFINNDRGRSLFESIEKRLKFVKQMDIPYSEIKNRIYKYYPHNKNKQLFFDYISKGESFSKAVENASQGKYDIAIVGIPTVENFGGSLTYVALYNVIQEMNYTCAMIERPKNAIHSPTPISRIYYETPFKNNDLIPFAQTRNDLREFNNISDVFIVGSDQLFHKNLMKNFSGFALLDWVDNNKKKIAYAASFGHETFTGEEIERAEMSYYLKKFDAFSCRENSGVSLAKKDFGVDAVQVLDPVFLCDKKVYIEMITRAKKTYKSNYISAYILDPNPIKSNLIDILSEAFHKKVFIYSEMFYNAETIKSKWTQPIEIGKIEDRLSCIAGSDFVIADSFHGVCMAIIFRKQFIAIANNGRGKTRFASLLDMFGLSDRLIDETDDLNSRLNVLEQIDYDKVYEILETEKNRSKAWLMHQIENSTKKSYTDYDIIIKKMTHENNLLQDQLNKLNRFLRLEYTQENNIVRYLDAIEEYKDNLLICISAKDTPGMSIGKDINAKLKNLGIKTDLTNKHWCGYSSIIYRGKAIDEKCIYDKEVSCNYSDDLFKIKNISGPLHCGNRSVIEINGVDYSTNVRGLNFVVIDLRNNSVVDAVGFDTHHYLLGCTRKSYKRNK